MSPPDPTTPDPTTLADTANRAQHRAAEPHGSRWVAASAGTGKTKVLTDRVLRLLLAGAEPRRLLCLTYTTAAAAEMANRVAALLGRWAVLPETELAGDLTRLLDRAPEAGETTTARRLFAGVLDLDGGLRIQTLHAFCQSVLARFPLEAGVPPHFQVLDAADSAEALASARDAVLAGGPDTAPWSAALARLAGRLHESRLAGLLDQVIAGRGRLDRLFATHGGPTGAARAVAARLGVAEGETPEAVLARASQDLALDGPALRQAAQALADSTAKGDQDKAQAIATFLATGEAARPALFEDYLKGFLTAKKEPYAKPATKAIQQARPDVVATLERERDRLLAVLDHWRAVQVAQASADLLVVGAAILDAYRAHKRARGRLDFEDLIAATRGLLETPGRAAWVLFKLDGGLDHLLIDEAQDTSPDQWAIVETLAEEFFAGEGQHAAGRRSLFVVGDRKQSIYSFQGADPEGFSAMRARFKARIEAAGGDFATVPLAVSFRSGRAVLEAVDAILATPDAGAGVLDPDDPPGHLAFRAGAAGSVRVWPPLAPAPAPESPPWKPPVERLSIDNARARLANLLADHIADRLAGGEILESRGRPLRPGDVMVLVRRRGAFVDDLVKALKRRGVPVAGADRLKLGQHLAVMDLIALGRVLLLPEDDLTLATVLKGPLLGLSEDALFDLAHPRGRCTLWQALAEQAEAGEAPFADAHQWLAELRGRADLMPPFELFCHVLGDLGGRRRLLARLGPDAEDALDEFLGLALTHQHRHPPALESFLHWLERGDVEVKRDLDQGADAVRVMTVHGAKGLQAPLVILPDTRQLPQPPQGLLWDGDLPLWAPRAELRDPVSRRAHEAAHAAQLAEYRRLLYVALTRAEDHLIVAGWETRNRAPDGNWHDLIADALAPLAELTDPAEVGLDGRLDGDILTLTCPQQDPVHAQATPPPAAPPPAPDWLGTPPPAEPRPGRPLMPSRPELPEPAAPSPLVPKGGESARQRGRLVHRLLELLPELPAAQRPAAARRFLTRPAHNLAPDQAEALAAETLAVLDHPDLAPLFGPGALTEVPISGRLGSGDTTRLVSGQIDRLLITPTSLHLIEFKTNRPPPTDPRHIPQAHLQQMAAYHGLLKQLYPAHTLTCTILWTAGPHITPVPTETLDAVLPAI
ncbi:double-strand break repair helicase AddA [Roseospirillum parvum]|uniref:DNA 3'-5' helicase n=1 Tax=Roseospirillum parvum TaxID=83401 RepID=A0A1G7WQT6_9PROT|nr:double-strand break repair helicase AddA [Roseospirillum parvum]SDG74283.1 DNA helicase/exodeoxyribonuclease V, subunit A [Roseospirillum parvum]